MPCNQWSDCPAGAAGVGLKCKNGSFFEPNAATVEQGGVSITASNAGVYAVSGTRLVWNGSSVGSGTAGCVDGLIGAFSAVKDLVVVRGVVWVADAGCRAVRTVDAAGNVATVVPGVDVAALVLLPNGLVLASDSSGGGKLFSINPETLVSRVVVLGMGDVRSMAVIPREPFVVLVATGESNISFVGSTFTLLDSAFTPTKPLRVAYAGAVIYGDGRVVYQMTPGGDFVNIMGLDVGPRMFIPSSIGVFVSMEWNSSALLMGTSNGVVPLRVCNPCPGNSSTDYSGVAVPGLGRCQCVAGMYMDKACKTCPSGVYCPRGTTAPVVCPAGFWCGKSSSAPVACDVSVYCAVGSVDAFGTVPGPGQGALCSIGYYRSSVACVLCPSMSTTLDMVATSVAQCVCSSTTVNGRVLYTFMNTTMKTCQICPATRYCPLGSTIPLKCPPGAYCSEGVREPQTCPVGFYCPEGVPAPLSCSAGTFCDIGVSVKASCPAMFYCPLEATNIIPCPAGSYCPTASGQPLPCVTGSYCGASAAAPSKCPVGYWCGMGVSAGTRCPLYSSSLSGAASMSACFCISGYYGPGGDLCAPCPVGARSRPGSPMVTDCACNAGFKLGPDFSECVACAGDEYCPGGALASTCPAGFVCSSSAADLCLERFYCPENTISGIRDPVPCPAGGFCVNGSGTFSACPEGYYCGASVSVPDQCPGGYYCPLSTSVPIECAGGVQCAKGSISESVECSAGSFCPKGTEAGIPCGAGRYCPAASSGETICPADTFCGVGSAAPIPCPLTTSTNMVGATSVSQCQCGPGNELRAVGGQANVYQCEMCSIGYYKAAHGPGACVLCSTSVAPGDSVCVEASGSNLGVIVGGAVAAVASVGAVVAVLFVVGVL